MELEKAIDSINEESQVLETVIGDMEKHLRDMSKHPTYGKYAYFKLQEIQKFMLDHDDDLKKSTSGNNM